ncbi:zinc finger HIT domain-containing protein 2 [Austrofundulus limnaeus]|uniref:Zinc finger HIT domain-containing protein 2 n=1 Tax=Austrofundulus limnaeus TaxID=52670 RepID=A0A2I4D226_AUSLI|nr:PREDICTED: zinc finger HIT domain-containing protein 2 [Austrofundulus limnaeus]
MMNPLIRRSLPPSVRSLLTDIISSKELQWTETEEETTTDGILLPSRGAGSEQEDFLSPAKTEEEKAAEDGSDKRKTTTVCMLCECKPSNYTCPRCNLHYCGLACYRSPDHSVCSEEFYKESVLRELKDIGKTEAEGKKKMQEILLGLRQKAEMTHVGMERLLREVGVVGDDTDEGGVETTEKVQALELLSRLAELQQSGEENTTEIEAILRKLQEIGRGETLPEVSDEDDDGAEGELNLAERLSGLDTDKLSEEELWGLLSSKEQEEFINLMKGGAVAELVPLWKPWWEEHEEDGRKLVEVLEEVSKLESEDIPVLNGNDDQVKVSQEKGQNQGKSGVKLNQVKGRRREKMKKESSSLQKVPPISAKIPTLSSLCSNPSPLVRYGLVNALYSYAFSLSLFNGDTDSLMFEFCDMTLALSEALSSNKVFNSVQEALDHGESLIRRGGYLDREDPLAPARAVEAVAHIMTGRERQDATAYCLAALSQLRSVLSKARTSLPKEGDEGARRQRYFLASKKCEFFQAWVLVNSQWIHRLAIELWNEHSKKESARNSVKKVTTVVKESLTKEKRKGNHKLIEELS